MNTVTATTKIEDLINERNKIDTKIANIIAETLADKNMKNASDTIKFIRNVLKPLSVEDQNQILAKSIVALTENLLKQNKSSESNEKPSFLSNWK